MRSADERVAAVRNRSKRLRRRRNDRALVALVCFMALPLVTLVGRYAMGDLALPVAPNGNLFGASSLLGPSVGGYVLVAVASFAVAVVVTVLVMLRKRSPGGGEHKDEGKGAHHGKMR